MGAQVSQQAQLEQFRSVAKEYDANKGNLSDQQMLDLLKNKLSEVPDNLFATVDYDKVREDIKKVMDDPAWDDGTYGPFLIRLAWHSSGTYDKSTKTGGSNGATMRFAPESSDPENAGLDKARGFLEQIKAKHPGISYSDLWILAGYVAIENSGGPKIAFQGGRTDGLKEQAIENGRLPGAEHGTSPGVDEEGRVNGWENLAKYIRDDIFYRMGLNDREIVALLCGGHVYGRCHTYSSGYAGAWVENMTMFSNEYAADMIEDEWIAVQHDSKMPDGGDVPEEIRPAPGRTQYVDLTIYNERKEVEAERKHFEVQLQDAENYNPGKYKCVSQWVNSREGADTSSPILGRFLQEEEMVILSIKKTIVAKDEEGNETFAIRGRAERGGWVSIIGSGGKTLFESVAGLEESCGDLVGKYRITSDVKLASAPGQACGETTLKQGQEVEVTQVKIHEGGVYVRVDEQWAALCSAATGCTMEKIVDGYNTKARVAIKGQTGHQMMLVSDMVLLWDPNFRQIMEEFAAEEGGEETLVKEFGAAFKKLTELGCPFAEN